MVKVTFKNEAGTKEVFEAKELFRQNDMIYFYTTKGEYIIRPASQLVKERKKASK